MSNETPDNKATPGTTASDDSPTAEVPRIPRPDKEPASPAAPSRPASNVKTIDKGNEASGNKVTPGGQNGTGKPVAESSGSPSKPAEKDPSSRRGSEAPPNKPMTAGEYARTTKPSPSTTSVIPVVKDQGPKSSLAQATAAASASSGRQASLKLVRVDPWSVTKVTFALTVALMIVAVVAVTILWIVLSFAGVWDQINSSVTTVLSDESSSFDITEYLGFGRIVGLTLVLSAINVVIVTAVATIGAYLYNLAAQLLGGVDVTLAEDN